MSSELTVIDRAHEINASWKQTTDGLLKTACLCATAHQELKPDEKKELMGQLDFSASTFSKLAKIGSKDQLHAIPIRPLLPPNFSIMYEVAKLKDDERQAAADDGILNPGMTRADLTAWLSRRRAQGKPSGVSQPKKLIAKLEVPEDYDANLQAKLLESLEKLKAKYHFDMEKPADPTEKAFNRIAQQIDDFIRKEARRFIKQLKQTRMRALKGLSKEEKEQRWGFKWDEIDIPNDASWDDVQRALEVVGCPDQFDRIRDEALRLHGLPEEMVRDHPLEDHDEVMKAYKDFLSEESKRGSFDSERYREVFSDLK